jgi:hypothetical protein
MELRQNGDRLLSAPPAALPNPWTGSRVATAVEDGGFITFTARHTETRHVRVTSSVAKHSVPCRGGLLCASLHVPHNAHTSVLFGAVPFAAFASSACCSACRPLELTATARLCAPLGGVSERSARKPTVLRAVRSSLCGVLTAVHRKPYGGLQL